MTRDLILSLIAIGVSLFTLGLNLGLYIGGH